LKVGIHWFGVVDWISQGLPIVVSAIALGFAALTWLESRRQRQLLETMVKSIVLITRRRRSAKRPKTSVPPSPDPAKAAAEERRKLRLELEREKLQWRKNRDVAKAIGWFVEQLAAGDDEEDDEP
jgi:hypothetical protein